ncbi:MAG: NYN domain-containing protein [Phycisphaerae bacterium]|nr:NYN domain-containing protein [Phycisphaerae bacterium]
MPYLIDGCNLLRTILDHDERFHPVDEVRMCWTVGRYLSHIADAGEVVFDGAGPNDKSRFDSIPGLAVSFAGGGREADDVIEEKIQIHASSDPLIVVSNDRRLRQAAVQGQASALHAEDFWERVLAEANRKRPPAEPTAKRHGLSESETRMWLEAFGLGQDGPEEV